MVREKTDPSYLATQAWWEKWKPRSTGAHQILQEFIDKRGENGRST